MADMRATLCTVICFMSMHMLFQKVYSWKWKSKYNLHFAYHTSLTFVLSLSIASSGNVFCTTETIPVEHFLNLCMQINVWWAHVSSGNGKRENTFYSFSRFLIFIVCIKHEHYKENKTLSTYKQIWPFWILFWVKKLK